MKSTIRSALCGVLLFCLGGCAALGPTLETAINRKAADRDAISRLLAHCSDCQRMRGLFVADLHADTLLWGRNPLRRSEIGHVDLIRLREAGVDLQIFGVPSLTPLGRERPGARKPEEGDRRCTDREKNLDTSGLLFEATARGEALTPRQIAYAQARSFCRVTGGKAADGEKHGSWDAETESCRYPDGLAPGAKYFYPVQNADDLAALRTEIARKRAAAPGAALPVGAILSLEGVHWIEKVDEVGPEIAALARAGFRIVGLTHKFTNPMGGSDESCASIIPGLDSKVGMAAAREVLDQGLILDAAHMSNLGVFDPEPEGAAPADLIRVALAHPGAIQRSNGQVTPRVVMSHGATRFAGCRASVRGLKDVQARKLLQSGVPFGVIHWDGALCAPGADREVIEDRILRVYEDAVELVGPDIATRSLALGADLDGAVRSPYDVTGFPWLLSRLRQEEWCQSLGDSACMAAIGRIAGENVYDFLCRALPRTGSLETCLTAGGRQPVEPARKITGNRRR